ncbi:MAG: hypothetical protein AAGJ32_05150 [Pseudomonadota bacterium]
MTEQSRRVDGRVGMLTRYVATALDDMSDDDVFREAIVKAAIRDFAFDLVRAFPDHQDTIAEVFGEMANEVPGLGFEDVSD